MTPYPGRRNRNAPTNNNHNPGRRNRNAPTNNHNAAAASDSATFLEQSQTLIPAEVRMISGCEDEQTSADVFCGTSGLPNPKGRAGGACTSALLEILHQNAASKLTFQQVLMKLRDKLGRQGHSQIPQLTSSRPLDLDDTPFSLIASPTGARRALLVGINYHGQSGELRGCHNDVHHMKDYLVKVHGFPAQDILVLMDDAQHHAPNREKIIRALRHLVSMSQPGDAVFFHYSGHGGLLSPDFNSFKTNSKDYDQTLIPVDHKGAGQIRDFSLFHHFVQPMPAGVVVTCLMDCCHSGSVLDLPYSFKPTKTGRGSYAMQENLGMMSNLAFLYMLGGGMLPPTDLFSNVTNHLQDTVGGDLGEYQGMMGDSLAQDMDANAFGDAADATDAVEGFGDMGDYGGDVGDMGDYGNVVAGEDVAQNFGGDAGYGDAGDAFAGGDGGEGFGFNFGDAADMAGDEGCGDEGCGDLLSTIADCLNDAA